MRKTVIVILISLAMAAVAIAARIDTVPLVPGGVRGSDKVPMGRPGTTTDYTASMDQIKVYVFGNNTTNPGVYTFNGRDGAVTPQAGDYTAAQVGADPSGTAAVAVATHNSVYNHLNIPTNQQIGAMTGTSGTPSSTNAFVTNSDSRNSNARTPTAHAASHALNGTDPLTLVTSQVQGLDAALAGKQASLSNAAALGKITESGNLPLWNGGAWPGGNGGGDMYKATYDPQGKNGDAFARANHTGTQTASTITGLAPSATTDTTTTANIAPSTDKRFVTDAQQSVLINTSGVNSGNVTIGTANGLSLTGQQLSLQLATNAQPGALSAADHTNYSQAASLAATAAQVSDSFTFKTTDTTLYGKAAGYDSTGVLGAAPDATSSTKGVVTVSGNTTVAASVTGTKTANKQLAFDASGNVIASSYDVGTAGGGVGTGTQYNLPVYASGGTTLVDSGVKVSSGGTTLTTVQGTSPDALTLRPGSANGTSGVTLLGPSGATTAYSLQFPTTGPTAGQIPIFGTPASGIVPVTWGANGSGTYAPIDSPTFTTKITTPAITTNSADGAHSVDTLNTVAYTGSTTDGNCFYSTYLSPHGWYCYENGTPTQVQGTGATLLSALTDTAISTPLTNQVLQYNGTKWVNATVATGGGSPTVGDTVTALSTDSTITHGAAYVVTSAATLAFRNHSSGSYRVYAEAATKLKPDAATSQFKWVHPANFGNYSTSKGYSVTLAANSYATVISDGSGVFRVKADQPLSKTGVNEYYVATANTTKPAYNTALRTDGHWSVTGLTGAWAFNEGSGSTFKNLVTGVSSTSVSGTVTWGGGVASVSGSNTMDISAPATTATVVVGAKVLTAQTIGLAGTGANYPRLRLRQSETASANVTLQMASSNYIYFNAPVGTFDNASNIMAYTITGTGQTDIGNSVGYLNGTQLSTTQIITTAAQSTRGAITIGNSYGGTFSGDMNVMLVYNRVLTASELASITTNPWQVFAQ